MTTRQHRHGHHPRWRHGRHPVPRTNAGFWAQMIPQAILRLILAYAGLYYSTMLIARYAPAAGWLLIPAWAIIAAVAVLARW